MSLFDRFKRDKFRSYPIRQLKRFGWQSTLSLPLLLILFTLTACAPKALPKFQVGTNTWLGYAPLYLAEELGLFEQSNIRMVELSSASDVLHALRIGMIDAAALTLDEAILAMSERYLDLKVVLIFDYSEGADALIAKPSVASLSDLKGRTVAVESTAVGAYMLNAALKSAGLAVEEVEILNCEYSRHQECFSSVDAIVTFEPARTILLQGNAHELFSSREISGEIVDVLVVPADVIEQRGEQISALVEAYYLARKHMEVNPSKAYEAMAAYLEISYDEYQQALSGIVLPSLSEVRKLMPSQFDAVAHEMADFMASSGLIKQNNLPTSIVDRQFLPESNL